MNQKQKKCERKRERILIKIMDNDQIILSKKCIETIQRATTLLKIKTPEIYFINETSSRTELYSQDLKFISEDFRDIGYKIEKVRFIPKEYVIYINTKIFENEISMLCHCYQISRYVYQIDEVRKLKNNLPYNDTEPGIRQWAYMFDHITDGVNHTNSPICYDMMAFAKIMLKEFHNIQISFKDSSNKYVDDEVNSINRSNLKKNINSYKRKMNYTKGKNF